MFARIILSQLSRSGQNALLSVFIFHRVHAKADPLAPGEPDAVTFEERMRWIRSMCNVLPLDVAVTKLKEGSLPASSAAITFDDGYADNLHVAVPILMRLGMSATFFIATGFIDGGLMFNDHVIEAVRLCNKEQLDLRGIGLGCYPVSDWSKKRLAIAAIISAIKYCTVAQRDTMTEAIARLSGSRRPSDLMLTSRELQEMSALGMQIGAHTVTHPIIALLDDSEVTKEIRESKEFLENLLGKKVGMFAYPNGKSGVDYHARQTDLVRRLGFDAAFTTEWGVASQKTDPFQIPRFTPWDKSRLRFSARVAMNLIKGPLAHDVTGQVFSN